MASGNADGGVGEEEDTLAYFEMTGARKWDEPLPAEGNKPGVAVMDTTSVAPRASKRAKTQPQRQTLSSLLLQTQSEVTIW